MPINKLIFNIIFDYSFTYFTLPLSSRNSFPFAPAKHTASSSNALEGLLVPKADEQDVNFYCVSNPSVQKQCIRRPETSAFDTWYRKRIISLIMDNPTISLPSIKNSSDVNSYMYGTITKQALLGYGSTLKIGNLPLVPNPWLAYLNLKHQTMPTSYQSKMYLYAAVNMPAIESDDKDKTTDIIKFDLASNGVKRLGSLMPSLDDFGYWNDGPVPLTGQLMDMSKSFDEWVVLSNNSTIVTSYASWLFGKTGTFAKYNPGSVGYEGNGYAKHRLFMDYNHDRMLNGCYTSDPADLVKDTLDSSNNIKTCWKNPADWITYLTYASDKNKGNILPGTALPDSPVGSVSFNLLEEPLFLAIQQDLIPPTDPKTKLDCIFNWAECMAPDFAPVNTSYKSEIDPLYPDYYYRPYANDNYLIGSTAENQFYIYGKNRPLTAFETISNMAKSAGCNP